MLPPLPSHDGGVVATLPLPPTFFTAKIFEKFFHRWKIDRMAILAKKQKRHEGKSERGGGGGGGCNNPPPPEREG